MREAQTRWNMSFSPKKLRYVRQKIWRYNFHQFGEKINLIESILECQLSLVGYYLNHTHLKYQMGLSYRENIVMNNALLNLTLFNMPSALELIRHGYYGSARLLLRQGLEMLIISKYAEFDSKTMEKWKKREFGKDKVNETRLGEILNELHSKGSKVVELRKFWAHLSTYAHASRYSQQSIGTFIYDDKPSIEEFTTYFNEMHHTLDLAYALVVMENHLANKMSEKARRFYFGYEQDPFGDYQEVKKLKNKIKILISEYYNKSKKRKCDIHLFRPLIREYKSNWGKKLSPLNPSDI